MKVLALVSILITTTSFAQGFEAVEYDQATRIDNTYQDLNEQAGIRCKYTGTGTHHTLKRFESKVVSGESITTDYSVDDNPFSIVISPNSGDGSAKLVFGDEEFTGKVSNDRWGRFYRYVTNNIKIKYSKLVGVKSDLARKYDLPRLKCEVEIAVASMHQISDINMHINVHPHRTYDFRGRSTDKVQEYLDQFDGQQLVLLDDKDKKGDGYDVNDFLEFGSADLTKRNLLAPQVSIPQDIPMLVSPAGHNEYIVSNKNQNIMFTGGNHNYCIWNNTKHIIDAAFVSDSNESLNFTFDTSAIVVQKGGLVTGTSIPKSLFKKSNLLEDVFNNSTVLNRAKYLQAFFDSFAKEFLEKKKGMFAKVTLVQEGLKPQTVEVTGSGKRDFIIKFNYIHEELEVELNN
jgi:hypothetical protein